MRRDTIRCGKSNYWKYLLIGLALFVSVWANAEEVNYPPQNIVQAINLEDSKRVARDEEEKWRQEIINDFMENRLGYKTEGGE